MTASAAPALVEAFERLTAALLRRRGIDSDTLPPTQRVALAAVVGEGPLRLRALAERIGTTDATASRTVDALEAAGLVERTVAPEDRRGVVVAATRSGRRRLDERRRQFAATLEAGLADLPPEDAERLVRLLDELAEAVAEPGLSRRRPAPSSPTR
ncbi:MAG: MarR family winged helix-turn-helix transcriptional regulator [Pseudomonadota bacterium]